MSFDGSGNYLVPAGTAAISGAVINASNYNALLTDLQTALTKCVTRDGQSPPTANLPMASRKLTGLAAGSVAGDSVRFEQIPTLAGLGGAPLEVPVLTQAPATAVALADSGKVYVASAAGTWTIPANASIAFAIGTTLAFINPNASACTISITTDTLTLAGTTSTGSRTLLQNGWATAIKVTATSWIISGPGVF
jgi:hypothetical protein